MQRRALFQSTARAIRTLCSRGTMMSYTAGSAQHECNIVASCRQQVAQLALISGFQALNVFSRVPRQLEET